MPGELAGQQDVPAVPLAEASDREMSQAMRAQAMEGIGLVSIAIAIGLVQACFLADLPEICSDCGGLGEGFCVLFAVAWSQRVEEIAFGLSDLFLMDSYVLHRSLEQGVWDQEEVSLPALLCEDAELLGPEIDVPYVDSDCFSDSQS